MHPANRKQMAEWQIATARKAQAVFGGYSSESSMDHIAPALDNVLYVSTYPVYMAVKENRILKLIEYSGRPMFYFQNYNTIEPMKQVYDLWQPLKHLQVEFIDSHEKLADGVYRTRWENGEEVVVNYSPDKAFSYRGRDVAPKGYEFYRSQK